MYRMSADQISKWIKERNAAVCTMDVETFRHFYAKWQLLGLYAVDLPADDRVVEIILRKMAVSITSIPKNIQQEAAKWLKDNGYDASIK